MSPRWRRGSRGLVLTVALTSFRGLVSVPFLPASDTAEKGSRSLTILNLNPQPHGPGLTSAFCPPRKLIPSEMHDWNSAIV